MPKASKGFITGKLKKFVLLSAAVSAIVAGILAVFYLLDPVAFRATVFQPAREVRFFILELNALDDWGSIEKIVLPEPETVTIPAAGPDDVDIVAGIYRPAISRKTPLMVLQHGSYPWGRKAGLIRMLGTRLAEKGFLVIAPDARGFGDSGDPETADRPEAWRTSGDLSRILDYVIDNEVIDPSNIFVLGHSMGANHTLEGGLADPRVKALVLVGPGRYTQRQDILVPRWIQTRFSADRGLEQTLSRETIGFAYSLGNLRLLARSKLADAKHKPILLIDGAREGEAKLSYLRNIIGPLNGPIEYHTLPGTGHYCGVRSFYGSESVYYQPKMFEPFFNIIMDFL